MTRMHKMYLSVLVVGVATLAIGSSAMAASFSSITALVGDEGSAATERSGYSSPTAIMADAGATETQTDHSSVNAIIGDGRPSQGDRPAAASDGQSSLNSIVGPGGVTSTGPLSASPATGSDGFDWTDALIGAGVTFGLALTTALLLGTMRRRTRVEPSV